MSYWIYINHIHRYARIHQSTCPHCNNGLGTHGARDSAVGRWEPAETLTKAWRSAAATGYATSDCGHCQGACTRGVISARRAAPCHAGTITRDRQSGDASLSAQIAG